MAQFGKASAKRSKPSYFMSVMGVTIVLFLVGIFGWLLLNASRYTEELKEDVKMQVYVRKTVTPEDIEQLRGYLATKPYTRTLEFLDKEAAKAKLLEAGEEDFTDFLDG